MTNGNLNDAVKTPLLTGYAREIYASGFPDLGVLDEYFPIATRLDNKWKWDTTILADEPAVTYRAPDTELPIGDRQGVSSAETQLPPFGKKKVLTEEHKIMLDAILNRGGDFSDVIGTIYDDISNLVRGVRNRHLIDKGFLLSNGYLTVNGEALSNNTHVFSVTVNYNVPNTQTVTAATLWSDLDNSDPLADFISWGETFHDNNNGLEIEEWLVPRIVQGYLLRNEAFRQAIYGPTLAASAPSVLTVEQVNAVLQARGVAPIRVVSAKATNEWGQKVDVLDQTKVIGIPQGGGLANMAIGTTAEALGMYQAGTIVREELPGIIAVSRNEDDPPVTYNGVTGYGMPVLQNPQLLFIATVKAA